MTADKQPSADETPETYKELYHTISRHADGVVVPNVGALIGFANAMLERWPDGDVDGGHLHDFAVKFGLLEPHRVAQPCCEENCQCAEYGDFPTTCYRKSAMLSAAPKHSDCVVVPRDYTLVKTETLKWLLGETENENGVWFERPVGAGAFWWRTDLRKAMLPAAPSVKGGGE